MTQLDLFQNKLKTKQKPKARRQAPALQKQVEQTRKLEASLRFKSLCELSRNRVFATIVGKA